MMLPPSALPVVGVRDINPAALPTTGEVSNMASPMGVTTITVYDPASIGLNVQVIEEVMLETFITPQGYIPIVILTGRGGKLLLNNSPMVLGESP